MGITRREWLKTADDEVEHRPVFFDQWDGYPAARQRLYDSLGRHGRGNAVVLTGDLHGACVFDLPRDPWSGYVAATGEGSLAVEFICTSVTSPYLPFVPVTTEEDQLARACPHLAWTNLVAKGYSVVTVTTEYVQNDFYASRTCARPRAVRSGTWPVTSCRSAARMRSKRWRRPRPPRRLPRSRPETRPRSPISPGSAARQSASRNSGKKLER